jgi:hypothetical protein
MASQRRALFLAKVGWAWTIRRKNDEDRKMQMEATNWVCWVLILLPFDLQFSKILSKVLRNDQKVELGHEI